MNINYTIVTVAAGAALSQTAGAQERLYVAHYRFEDPKLQTMNLDGTDVQDLFGPQDPFPTNDWLPVGLALDESGGRIYWMHGSTPGRIGGANLDGSGQQHPLTGLKIPRGVDLDLSAGKMYWTASPPQGSASGIIDRANLDGTGHETVFMLDPYDPLFSKVGRPTVDAVNGYVYFGANGEIKRVNLDGPPFVVHTVATGGSTITRVQLDVANNHLYWIDSDTISDCLIRVNLDNTGFAVIVDTTPDFGSSSGLTDLALDLAGGKAYWTDEIGTKGVFRADLDGQNAGMIHASPGGYSASALIFDVNTSQAILDCNGNDVRDKDDIDDGTSEDCNENGIPDECENHPCAPPALLLDQGLDTDAPGRALGGTAQGQGWMVFQPFDVPAGGWNLGRVFLNGVTWNINTAGFTVTLFPDNGNDYPDETQPMASADSLFRFGPTWDARPLSVTLPAGRFWLRLEANDTYVASVFVGTSGLESFSRSNLGNDFFGRPPIALRLQSIAPGDGDGDGDVDIFDFDAFLDCVTGPGGGVETGCLPFDFDGDDDVDWSDFAAFQSAFTG